MKREIWIALMSLSATQISWASPATQRLPEAMVMVAPPLDSVGKGLEIQRLVHGQFKQDGDQTVAVLHLIRRPLGQSPTCEPGSEGCLPNVSDALTLQININDSDSQHTLPSDTRDEPITASSSRRTPIFRELFQRLAIEKLDIRNRGDTWMITPEGGVTTIWQPMSLEQASSASYFAEILGPPVYEIEQCVASQLADVLAAESPTAAQRYLLDAVSVNADVQRLDGHEKSTRYRQALNVEFASQLLSRSADVPDSPAAFVSTSPYNALAQDSESRAWLMDNFSRIEGAARYWRRLDRLSHNVAPGAQSRIICNDLVTLDSP